MNFPNFVTKCNVVGSAINNSRYSLEIDMSGSTKPKTAIIFLLNPSSTAKEFVFYPSVISNPLLCNDVDLTTSNVIDSLHNIGYNKIYLLNLFPYFDSKPSSLDAIYSVAGLATNQSYIDNLREIDNVLSGNKGSDVFIAWGKDISINQQLFLTAKIDVINKLVSSGFSQASIKTSKNNGFTSVKLTLNQSIDDAIHGRFI